MPQKNSQLRDLQDSFDELTRPEPYGTGHTGNPYIDAGITALSDLGAGSFGLLSPLVHPNNTINSLAHPLDTLDRFYSQMKPQYGEGTTQYMKRLGGTATTLIPSLALGQEALHDIPVSTTIQTSPIVRSGLAITKSAVHEPLIAAPMRTIPPFTILSNQK